MPRHLSAFGVPSAVDIGKTVYTFYAPKSFPNYYLSPEAGSRPLYALTASALPAGIDMQTSEVTGALANGAMYQGVPNFNGWWGSARISSSHSALPPYENLVVSRLQINQGEMVIIKTSGSGKESESTVTQDEDLLPKWLIPTISAFIRLQALESNWDSYGAPPVSTDILNRSLTFLRSVMKANYPAPAVVPIGDGGVQLEWHRQRRDFELIFPMDSAPEFFFRDTTTGDELEGPVTDSDKVGDFLGKIA